MFILGLTGSLGMGKSATAKMFADEGVPVHDADAVVHHLYEAEAVPLIEAAFPGTTAGGKVDRDRLAIQVLGNGAAIKRLESIVHPLVAAARDRFLAESNEKVPQLRCWIFRFCLRPAAISAVTPSSWFRRRPTCSACGHSRGPG